MSNKSRAEKIQLLEESMEELSPLVMKLADKMIVDNNGLPEFSYEEALAYFEASLDLPVTKKTVGTLSAIAVTLLELTANMKINRMTGVDEQALIKQMVEGRQLTEEELREVLYKRMEELKNEQQARG